MAQKRFTYQEKDKTIYIEEKRWFGWVIVGINHLTSKQIEKFQNFFTH